MIYRHAVSTTHPNTHSAAGSGPVPPAAAAPTKEPANGVPVGYPAVAPVAPPAGAPAAGAPPAGYPATGAPAGYPAPNPYTAAGAAVAGAPVYMAGGSAAPGGGAAEAPEQRAKASQLLQQSLGLLQQSLESVKSAQKTAGGMMVGNMVMNRPRPFMGPIGRGGRFGPNPMQTMGNVAANSAENAKLEVCGDWSDGCVFLNLVSAESRHAGQASSYVHRASPGTGAADPLD